MSKAPVVNAGWCGGFQIGPEFILDREDSMGLASDIADPPADDIRIWVGDTFANRASAPFSVSKAGILRATGAIISGEISAITGDIGGWELGATTLTGGNAILDSAGILTLGTGDDVAILSADDADYRLWIGDATPGDAPFSVDKTGALIASNATISGTIKTGTVIEPGVVTQFTLALTASGAPPYNVTGAGTYDAGDVVAITAANPPTGAAAAFSQWTGGWPDINYVEDVNDNTTFVVMDKDISLVADYV